MPDTNEGRLLTSDPVVQAILDELRRIDPDAYAEIRYFAVILIAGARAEATELEVTAAAAVMAIFQKSRELAAGDAA